MKHNDISIIEYLLKNREKELNILQIANGLKLDYKNTHTILTWLEKEDIVRLQPFGKSKKVVLLPQCHPLLFEAEYSRREDLLKKNKNLSVALTYFRKHIKSRLYVILLFGSHAKGTATKHSDIDLLFIVPDGLEEQFEKNVHDTISLIPLPLHVSLFQEKDFIAMKNSKQATVGSEAMNNNIILYGIEPYYEMIQ